MSRMPPSLSGGLVCASAALLPSASSEASTAVRIRVITYLPVDRRVACSLMSIARDHAAGLHPQQDDVACGDGTAGARTMHFPRYEIAGGSRRPPIPGLPCP